MAVILTSQVIGRRIPHVMGWCMIGKPLTFGGGLRRWRQRRRITKGLALAANHSTRHLSSLETRRAQPISDMTLRLQIPLRDHNTVLLAAGFAPAFQNRSLTELEAVRVAIDKILEMLFPADEATALFSGRGPTRKWLEPRPFVRQMHG
jgi:hypothetical protein